MPTLTAHLFLLSLLWTAAPPPPTRELDRPVTLSIEGSEIGDVLDYLQDLSEMEFAVTGELPASPPIHVQVRAVPLGVALDLIAHLCGHAWDQRETGIIWGRRDAVFPDPTRPLGAALQRLNLHETANQAVQHAIQSRRVSLDFQETPLIQVLSFLREISGINFNATPLAMATAQPVTLRVQDMNLVDALGVLALASDLSFRPMAGGVVFEDTRETALAVGLQAAFLQRLSALAGAPRVPSELAGLLSQHTDLPVGLTPQVAALERTDPGLIKPTFVHGLGPRGVVAVLHVEDGPSVSPPQGDLSLDEGPAANWNNLSPLDHEPATTLLNLAVALQQKLDEIDSLKQKPNSDQKRLDWARAESKASALRDGMQEASGKLADLRRLRGIPLPLPVDLELSHGGVLRGELVDASGSLIILQAGDRRVAFDLDSIVALRVSTGGRILSLEPFALGIWRQATEPLPDGRDAEYLSHFMIVRQQIAALNALPDAAPDDRRALYADAARNLNRLQELRPGDAENSRLKAALPPAIR